MLGLIAQFAPSFLRSDIIKRSTSLQWIWKRIPKHYSFSQSEGNFLKGKFAKFFYWWSVKSFQKENQRFLNFWKACFVPKLSQFKDFSRYSKKTVTRKFVMSDSSQGNADKLYWPITVVIIVEFSWYFIWSCSINRQIISNKNIFHNGVTLLVPGLLNFCWHVNLSHLYNFFVLIFFLVSFWQIELYWKKN